MLNLNQWERRLMVRISGFQPENWGSIPHVPALGKSFVFPRSIKEKTVGYDPTVAGSSPAEGTNRPSSRGCLLNN